MSPTEAPTLGGHVTPAFVLTADDFGRDPAVNRAVERAYREGLLTATSLMVAEPAFEGAVAVARDNPGLAVGLHAVAIDGQSVLGHTALPHITDPSGRFPADSYGLGVRYFFSERAREELSRELEAQFRKFAESGLRLSHADGHYHMHMHPSVLPIFLRLAETFGACGFRCVRDDVRIDLEYSRSRMALKVLWDFYYAELRRWAKKPIAESQLAHTDRVYGLYETGRMTEEYVIHMVNNLPSQVRTVEMYFHPSERDLGESDGPNPGDLQTLLSPKVRAAFEEHGIERISYRDLAEGCGGER